MTLLRAIAGLGPVALREHLAIARQDVGYALRVLAGQRGFTITALLSLAFGIGATTATFSLVDTLFLRPLPVADQDRLVAMYTCRSAEHRLQPGVVSQLSRVPTQCPRACRADGLYVHAVERLHWRRAATSARRHRVRQLLQRARCLCSARPRHRAVRCSCRGPAAGGGAFRRVLEAALRRESGSRRPDDSTERHGVDGDRRDAALVHRHRHRPSRRSLGADDLAYRVLRRHARPADGAPAAAVQRAWTAGRRSVDGRGTGGRYRARDDPPA